MLRLSSLGTFGCGGLPFSDPLDPSAESRRRAFGVGGSVWQHVPLPLFGERFLILRLETLLHDRKISSSSKQKSDSRCIRAKFHSLRALKLQIGQWAKSKTLSIQIPVSDSQNLVLCELSLWDPRRQSITSFSGHLRNFRTSPKTCRRHQTYDSHPGLKVVNPP